jgi:hypothetical protein
MHGVLGESLPGEIELAGSRVLSFNLSECQAGHLFVETEHYRCGGVDTPSTDLIAESADLSCLPVDCFDLVVVGELPSTQVERERAIEEIHRVLVPEGVLLTLLGPSAVGSLASRFDIQAVRGVDPVTRTPGDIHVCRKDQGRPDHHVPVPTELCGYAYHLSRKTGRRIVFCLAGPIKAGDQLPVESETGERVGEVVVGADSGSPEEPPKPWEEGFRFPPRGTYDLDPALPSGVYSLAGTIPFVHRREGLASIAVLLPSHTAVAFNSAGGKSLYSKPGESPVEALSFQRPLKPGLLLAACRPFVRWFAACNPYAKDTTYLIDSDLEDPGGLDGVEVLIVIGRSEYWTRPMREQFDAFVDRGGRALLLCSEVMYWQVRVDLARHQLYRYWGADPHPDPLWRTTLWRDPSLKYPVYPRTGGERWYGGLSAHSDGIGWGGMKIASPASPLLTGSGLMKGDVVTLPDAANWDGAPVKRILDGVPQVDFGEVPPWRHEVVAYNMVRMTSPGLPLETPATSLWMVLRRTPNAGTVIHGGTMGWCGQWAIGSNSPHSNLVRSLILQMLDVLRDDIWPFSFSPDDKKVSQETHAPPRTTSSVSSVSARGAHAHT